MNVQSTRGGIEVTLSEAIAQGLAPDGGLFMPPLLKPHPGAWSDTFHQRTIELLKPLFKSDPLLPHLTAMIDEAFTFDAPTTWLSSNTGLLELFHGPTSAFKDFGARFLAAALARIVPTDAITTVLVATSGDTGAAVASAFHNRPQFRLVILYPDQLVSARQAHQLGAFGGNVRAFRVAGTFDDCQNMVKSVLTDQVLVARHRLTSANSISLGRLLPQMAYYAHAALNCVADLGQPPSFVIPTGNLGNAFACLLARERGLPIDRVMLATNNNRALVTLAQTGVYEPTATVPTLANAMDVGAPSNVERLLHRFQDVQRTVLADSVDDAAIQSCIQRTFTEHGEIICPHTACAMEVLHRLRAQGDQGRWIVAATAHAAKFDSIVEPLIGQHIPVPPQLAALLAQPSHSEPLPAQLGALVDCLQ